jgi:hypothetical protein
MRLCAAIENRAAMTSWTPVQPLGNQIQLPATWVLAKNGGVNPVAVTYFATPATIVGARPNTSRRLASGLFHEL